MHQNCYIFQMSIFERLTSCLQQLQFQLNRVFVEKKQQNTKIQQQFQQLESDMESNINKTLQILESTSKNLGFTLTILSLTAQEHFDINCQFTISYRNLKFTGNEKQVIANEQINEKFMLPILEGKQTVRIEVWKVEGTAREVFNTFEISLRDIIGLESDSNTYALNSKSLKQPSMHLNYLIQVRGFGFDSWKRHNQAIDEEIVGDDKEEENFPEEIVYRNERAQERKNAFNKLFEHRKQILVQTKLATFDDNLNELDEIMNMLGEI